MYADGYGRMDLARAEHAVLAGGRGAGQCLDCADCTARCVHGIELPRRMEAAKRCSAERACAGGAAVRMELEHETTGGSGQVKNSMDRRGFLRLGFWNGRAGRRHGLRRRDAARAPYEGTPAFRTLRPHRDEDHHRQHGGHAHQRTRDLPGGL